MRTLLVLALTLGCAADSEEDPPSEVTSEVVTPEPDAAPPTTPTPDAQLAPDPEQTGGNAGRDMPDLPRMDVKIADPIEQ